jgi:hypothetical protein
MAGPNMFSNTWLDSKGILLFAVLCITATCAEGRERGEEEEDFGTRLVVIREEGFRTNTWLIEVLNVHGDPAITTGPINPTVATTCETSARPR